MRQAARPAVAVRDAPSNRIRDEGSLEFDGRAAAVPSLGEIVFEFPIPSPVEPIFQSRKTRSAILGERFQRCGDG